MKKQAKDNAVILGIVVLMAGFVLFGIAFEILKFIAVVKWIVS